MPDPNHFFEGRNLEADTKAIQELVDRPQDVEYSISELLFIRTAIDPVPATNNEEKKVKDTMISKTNAFVKEIMYSKNKTRNSHSRLDRLD